MAQIDNRRQSGLWTQNAQTGYYDRAAPQSSSSGGPYQYYQPPTTSSSNRRSFAERERAGSLNASDPYAAAADNAAPQFDNRRVQDVAQKASAKIRGQGVPVLTSDHDAMVKSVHAAVGDAGADHFAKTVHVNSLPLPSSSRGVQDYGDNAGAEEYQEYPPRTGHVSSGRGVPAPTSGHETASQAVHGYAGDTDAEHFAQTGHVNSAAIPSRQAMDPYDDDIPENLRTKQWTPEPTGPLPQKSRSVSDHVHRGSVPDKSPLQKLEMQTSKDEKRARLEEAEYLARQKRGGDTDLQRGGTLRSEKGRVVSDGSRRPSESTSDRYYQDPPREDASAPRFRGANDAFQSNGTPPIAREPQPYHHAPEVPRSMDSSRHRAGDRSAIPVSGPGIHDREFRDIPSIAREPRPYHHAPEEPRSLNVASYPHNVQRWESEGRAQQLRASTDGQRGASSDMPRGASTDMQRGASNDMQRGASNDMQRSVGGNDMQRGASNDMQRNTDNDVQRSASGKHRLRDAGYAGAGAAAAGAAGLAAYGLASDGRSKERYDGERDMDQDSPTVPHRSNTLGRNVEPDSPTVPQQSNTYGRNVEPDSPTVSQRSNTVGRSGSRKLQKRPPEGYGRPSGEQSRDIGSAIAKQQLQSDRVGGTSGSRREQKAFESYNDPDPISRDKARAGNNAPVAYQIPPQTAAGQAAKDQVGFENGQRGAQQDQQQHHRLGGMFHRDGHDEGRAYQASSKPLDDWKNAQAVRLTAGDLELDAAAGAEGKDAWWEKERSRRSSSSRQAPASAAQYDGPYEEEAKLFNPPMFLKCGPLLRYTGIRREPVVQQSDSRGGNPNAGSNSREIWRGTVMIVTEDDHSDYSEVPTLRIFAQPMDLLQAPPRHLLESGQELPPEFEDPIAGQVKISRTGRPLYVRPVHEIPGETDLSRQENNQGLYAATRTPLLGPQFSSGPDGKQSPHIAFQDKSRIKRRDGEKAGRYRETRAIRLHTERGFTFWRWNIEIELASSQHRVAYRINRGPALGFWVPARGETMNTMFHSCNGFSLAVDPHLFSGPDPLWRDVLNKHQHRPFHVMIGGGDQVYNDAAMRDTTLFREWLTEKNPEHKHSAPFSAEMQDELENFYLERYSMWFSQGLFAMAGSQIPMINVWDDHDIIDGFGSYPHHFMGSKVFSGLGAIAFKYYMLFQHQSVVAETDREEPSWILGASPGPYINELSRSIFISLGPKVKFLGIDCRTERMRDEILSQESYDILFDRARAEIRNGDTKHLIVLLGVPIAYPRLNFLENILTSRLMDPIKAVGRTGMLGGFVNKFDGGVEILDDLDDHWTAKHHKAERNWFIQELQELAAEKSVRVTILGGDVHLGAVGQFYTPKKFRVPKDHDHRYMPNIISSAIVNTPPPIMMADVLNRRNKIHHLDKETDEDLIPMFEVDVDGSKRNNKTLLPRRNYCTIREFHPGSTPPSTPPPERDPQEFGQDIYQEEEGSRRFPPGSMRRTMSLTRGGANKLVRRFSGSKDKNPPISLNQPGSQDMQRSTSLGSQRPGSFDQNGGPGEPPNRRPSFHRRPTNLSEKDVKRAAARGGAPDEEGEHTIGREPGHIDLEGGLDISLNMEIDQKDPSGSTIPYRLLVPALWYQGPPDKNPLTVKSKRPGLMARFRSQRKKRDADEEDDWSGSEGTQTPPTGAAQQGQWKRGADDGYAAAAATGVGAAGVAGAAASQQRASYGNDGAYDSRNGVSSQRRSLDQQTSSAYHQGYSGASPPIGSSNAAPHPGPLNQNPQQPPGANYSSYPQSGPYPSRQPSAPTSQSQRYTQQQQSQPQPPQQQQRPTAFARGQPQGQYEGSDGSQTPSDEYVDAPTGRSPPERKRPSKAERFFGLDGGRGGVGGWGRKKANNDDYDYDYDDGRDDLGQGGGGEPQYEVQDGGYEPERRKKKWQIWKGKA